jgi:hypothetical protein
MVGGINDSVLEATGVLQVQVKSAVLGAVCGGGLGANEGLELVETIGDDLLSMISIQKVSILRGAHTVLSGEVLVETEP